MAKDSVDHGMADQPIARDIDTVFSTNLRKLCQPFRSVAGLCRDLGVNRTQFNRYLSGESFPRPDVLKRICDFFQTDARILLEPVERITIGTDALRHPAVARFVRDDVTDVDEGSLPSGLYRFSRRSFVDPSRAMVGLIQITRDAGLTYGRGYESIQAMRELNLDDDPSSREWRGPLLRIEDGFAMLAQRLGGNTGSFNYFSQTASMGNSFWMGYTIRAVGEAMDTVGSVRFVMEHLGRSFRTQMQAARSCGLVSYDALPPHHRRLLRLEPSAA